MSPLEKINTQTIAYFSGILEDTRKRHWLSFHMILRIHASPMFSNTNPCNGDGFEVHWHQSFHGYLLSEVQLLVSSQGRQTGDALQGFDSCLSSWNGNLQCKDQHSFWHCYQNCQSFSPSLPTKCCLPSTAASLKETSPNIVLALSPTHVNTAEA